MKLIKNKSLQILLLFSAFMAGSLLTNCGTSQTAADKKQKALRIQEKIESPKFTFYAETAYPMRFSPIHLTGSYYDLKVSKDTVCAYLPYYGRVYVAPMDPTEGGIKFTSTKFEYKVEKGKRPGNWRITINTLDTGRGYSLSLDVWDNGSARLNVIDPDRQTIFFDGDIEDNGK